MELPPIIKPSPRRIILVSVLAPVLLAAAMLFIFDPSRYGFYPGCMFYKTTGLLCAGCGATRAMYQLLHGHAFTAFRFNPLLMISLPFILGYGARFLVRASRGQSCEVNIRPRWLWTILVILVVFSVVRNLPVIPNGLRPPDTLPTVDLHATR